MWHSGSKTLGRWKELNLSPCMVADYIRTSGLPEECISQTLNDLRFATELLRRGLLTEEEHVRLAYTFTDWNHLDIPVSDDQAGLIEQGVWLRDIQQDHERGLINDDYARKLDRLDPSWSSATFTLEF